MSYLAMPLYVQDDPYLVLTEWSNRFTYNTKDILNPRGQSIPTLVIVRREWRFSAPNNKGKRTVSCREQKLEKMAVEVVTDDWSTVELPYRSCRIEGATTYHVPMMRITDFTKGRLEFGLSVVLSIHEDNELVATMPLKYMLRGEGVALDPQRKYLIICSDKSLVLGAEDANRFRVIENSGNRDIVKVLGRVDRNGAYKTNAAGPELYENQAVLLENRTSGKIERTGEVRQIQVIRN